MGGSRRQALSIGRALAATLAIAACIAGCDGSASGSSGRGRGRGGEFVYAVNYTSGTVSVISTDRDVVIDEIVVDVGARMVVFTPDGRKAYVMNQLLDEVTVIDTSARAVLGTVAVGQTPSSIAASPDGRAVYVANTHSADISVISTATDTVTATIPVPGDPIDSLGGLGFSPDGSRFYVGGGHTGSVCIDCIHEFAYPSNAPLGFVTGVVGGGGPTVVTPGGTIVVLNGCGCCGNIQWIENGAVVETFPFGGGGNDLAVTPSGDFAYGSAGPCSGPGSRPETIDEFRTIDHLNTRTLTLTGNRNAYSLAISPDGETLYVGNSTGSVLKVRRPDLMILAEIPVAAGIVDVAVQP